MLLLKLSGEDRSVLNPGASELGSVRSNEAGGGGEEDRPRW